MNDVPLGPVVHFVCAMGNRFARLEDNRSIHAGAQLLSYDVRSGEPIDSTTTRFDVARHEATTVGASILDFVMPITLLMRLARVSETLCLRLLQPYGSRMPISPTSI